MKLGSYWKGKNDVGSIHIRSVMRVCMVLFLNLSPFTERVTLVIIFFIILAANFVVVVFLSALLAVLLSLFAWARFSEYSHIQFSPLPFHFRQKKRKDTIPKCRLEAHSFFNSIILCYDFSLDSEINIFVNHLKTFTY